MRHLPMVSLPFVGIVRSEESVMILLVDQSFSSLLQVRYSPYMSYKQNTEL